MLVTQLTVIGTTFNLEDVIERSVMSRQKND